jgi:hypothetical protein
MAESKTCAFTDVCRVIELMSLSCETLKKGFNTASGVELALRRLRRGHLGLTGRITIAVLSLLGRGGGLIIGPARSAQGPRPSSRRFGMGKVWKKEVEP